MNQITEVRIPIHQRSIDIRMKKIRYKMLSTTSSSKPRYSGNELSLQSLYLVKNRITMNVYQKNRGVATAVERIDTELGFITLCFAK
mmetsp:Transcript_23707/g.23598  ORF Transcript_23707/g.23598 Transcript_23707/m.23598 type:complete len:87 (+) Transcript_23707:353-613(+)